MTGISENGTLTASYTYDGDSRITQSSYRGITHQYTYDNMGRVKSISGNYGNPRTYTYDLAGNLTWIEEYELVKRYVYDEIYQLEKYVETYESDVLANMTYYYDSVGNITSRTNIYPNGVTYAENGNTYTLTDYDYYQHSYQYNAANRLEVWYEEFGRVWPDGSYYDVICSRSDYMSYDNNGNMTKKDHYSNMEPNENHTYTYDILNRLEKHTLQGGAVTTYHYGSDGLRDKKTTGSDTIKYYCDENGIVLNEANASGGHRATNVVGADGTIIARKNQSGDIGKFIKNEHGDVTNVISETASNTYKYEPWGTITAKTGTFDNPIRYSGEYYDDESGLIYLRNRYYDPSLRRFISEDPAKDGLNWYVYCGNNPVNYWDPTGLAIRIENNNSRVFDLLKKLTDDSITLNKDTGNVLIDNKVNIEQTPHRNGTMLVRRMIENENTILITTNRYGKNDFLYSEMNIRIDLDKTVYLTVHDTSNPKRSFKMPVPGYIKLAHEMAHADHFLRGTFDFSMNTMENQYYNYKGELVTENVRSEELRAFGPIEWEKRNNRHYRNLYTDDITENDIRWEHGLPLRSGYGSW